MGCNGIPGGQPYNREERSKRTETVRDPDPQKTNGQGEDNAYPERRPSKPASLKKRLKHVGVYLHSRHFTARGERRGEDVMKDRTRCPQQDEIGRASCRERV